MVAPTLPPRPSHRQTSLARLNSRLSPLPCRLAVTGRQAVCWKRQYPRRPRCCGRLGRGARTGWPRKRGHGRNIGLGATRAHPASVAPDDAGHPTCPTMTVSGSRGQIATLRKIDKRSAERLVRATRLASSARQRGVCPRLCPGRGFGAGDGPRRRADIGPDTAAFAAAEAAAAEARELLIRAEGVRDAALEAANRADAEVVAHVVGLRTWNGTTTRGGRWDAGHGCGTRGAVGEKSGPAFPGASPRRQAHMTEAVPHDAAGTARRHNATPPPDHTEGRERPRLWLHPPVTRSSRAATDFAFIPWRAADGASALPPGLATAISRRATQRPMPRSANSATMTTADQIDAAAGDLMARGPMTRTRALGAVSA